MSCACSTAVTRPRRRWPRCAALGGRRSGREFASAPLTVEELSQLLLLGCGVADRPSALPHRSAPSAGGLYAVRVSVLAIAVEGLDPGVYRYLPLHHRLARV